MPNGKFPVSVSMFSTCRKDYTADQEGLIVSTVNCFALQGSVNLEGVVGGGGGEGARDLPLRCGDAACMEISAMFGLIVCQICWSATAAAPLATLQTDATATAVC